MKLQCISLYRVLFSLGLSLFSNQKTKQQSYQRFSKIENFTKQKGWLPESYFFIVRIKNPVLLRYLR